MGYIEKHLAPGEQVVFRTRLHPVIFAGTAAFAAFVLGVVGLIVSRNELTARTVALLGLAGVIIAMGSLLPLYVRWQTSEFAVTDRGVLVKVEEREHRVDRKSTRLNSSPAHAAAAVRSYALSLPVALPIWPSCSGWSGSS